MYPMLQRLNDEWASLIADPTSQVTHWFADPPTGTPDDLAGVLAWIATEPDPALHLLISRAQEGDSLAARTVLQTMLGKLVLVSIRSARPGLTQEAAFTDLTCQMWVTVANYPLSARPTKIAANLWMDCAKQARRMWSHGQAEHNSDLSYSPDDVSWLLDHNITASPADADWSELRAQDLIATACNLGLITDDTAHLLQAVYGPYGLPGKVTAALWDISPAAVRTRCKRAVDLLARSADRLLEAV